MATTAAFNDPAYRAGVTELLGVLAYGELSASERLYADAAMAPDLQTKAEIMQMAAAEFGHFHMLRSRLEELEVDPWTTMAEFESIFEKFHRMTQPSDWLEGLVKAYVGDGLASDFYREIAAYLDQDNRELVLDTLSGTGNSQFVVDRVREAIEYEPVNAGRLALWGRRLMGEALTQAQTLAAERDGLTAVIVGTVDWPTGEGSGQTRPSMDFGAIARMFARITDAHAERMHRLGLDS